MAIFIIGETQRELLVACLSHGLGYASQQDRFNGIDVDHRDLDKLAYLLDELESSTADSTEITVMPFEIDDKAHGDASPEALDRFMHCNPALVEAAHNTLALGDASN